MNIKVFGRRVRNFSLTKLWSIVNFIKHRHKNNSIEFIIEDADWAIKRVGEYICTEIEKISKIEINTNNKPYTSFGRVIHFGSQYMWLDWGQYMSKNSHYVVSFFHGKPEDGPEIAHHVKLFIKSVPRLSRIVVSNSIVENRLIKWGVDPHKIIKIPIGVDMNLFKIPTNYQKNNARNYYNLPKDSIVIGSFQKDGVGWGDGLSPKIVKGPDIFLQTLNIIRKKINVSVLLTGPARGYVKAGLEDMGIKYTHTYVEEYSDLTKCYQALDLYLISSREEGGPMALMEGMASGVPIVSTPVGMAKDFIVQGENGHISELVSPESLADSLLSTVSLISDGAFSKEKIRSYMNKCSWQVVASHHLDSVYKPLL